MTRRSAQDLTTWGLRGVGAFLIFLLWKLHIPNRALDEIYGIVLWFVGFWYFLAIGPIRAFVEWHWPGAKQEREEVMRQVLGGG